MTQSDWTPQNPGDIPMPLPPGAPLPRGPIEKPEHGGPFLAAALTYAARGWRVHPLKPRDKKPMLDGWPEKATIDPAQIIAWWTQWPNANVGLVPGPQSNGLAVVDVDPRNGGTETLERLRRALASVGDDVVSYTVTAYGPGEQQSTVELPVLPRTLMVRTGSGGWHLYFDATQWFARKQTLPLGLGDGVEVKADDKHNIVAPPSVHPSGDAYVWLAHEDTLATYPHRWLAGPTATTTPQKPKITGTDDVAKARRALAALNPERADRYDPHDGGWLAVGMALHAVADTLLPDWDQWSRQSTKYAEGVCAEKWSGFKDKEHGLTLGSLLAWAQDDAVQVTWFHDIPEEQVTWLWPGVVPYGKLTLFIGDPGWGKSYLTTDLCARVSAGKPLPDKTKVAPAPALMVFCEDGAGDTVKPRLRACGADMRRVGHLDMRENGRLPNLDTDLRAIEAQIVRTGARLVVLDPVGAYIGAKANSWKDDDMRRLLGPVAKMAERTGCAIVGIMHLNKKPTANVLQRITGAMAFGGVARSVYFIGPHTEDADLPPKEQRRVFANAKLNIGVAADARVFRIVGNPARPEEPAKLVWEGDTQVTAKDMLMVDMGIVRHADKRAKARDLLKAELASGPQLATYLLELGTAEGISADTMRDAKKELGVVAKQIVADGKNVWTWRLPDGDLPF